MSTEEFQKEQEFITGLYARLDDLREEAESTVRGALTQVGTGHHQAKLERDVLVAEQSGLLAAFNAGESGLCFGRLDFQDGRQYHMGRIGIRQSDADRTPLVIDWRADIARPFYLATGYSPMGLRRRRHISTEGRTVTALHDEILDLTDTTRTGHEGSAADTVLLAALDAARSGRMHDIVRTIQAEQDRIIRGPHQGVLVVEGGPGTGKTVVALHRAAYLLYAYRDLLARRGVLIVGPNPAFLAYIGEVLPSLGETGVLLATVGELFPGVTATGTDTSAAAEVKGRATMADALARFVRDRQTAPDPGIEIEHDDGRLVLDRAMAEDARAAARQTGLPHNLARPHFAFRIIDALTEQLADRIGADPYGGPNFLGPDDIAQLGKAIALSGEVHAAIEELWPMLTPQQLVTEYLADPVYLPDIDAELIRRTGGPWTPADVPLLDEAAELLGHDDSAARAAEEAERQQRIAYAQGVLDMAYASRTYEFEDKEDVDKDASEVLGAHDIVDAERMAERHEEADHRSAAERAAADRTWAFGHIIVDEAQELSAMTWRLLMRRCPTRSMTLVGDPAQTGDEAGCDSWQQILGPYVGDRWEHTRLRVNYRTPAEIMEVAAGVRRAEDPSFEPPGSVRSTGVRPRARGARPEDLARTVAETVADEAPREGRLAVVAPAALHPELVAALPGASYGTTPDLTRDVVLLDPRQTKGLEFDTVVVVEPGRILAGSARGANDLYVALTRATQQLAVVHTGALPECLREGLTQETQETQQIQEAVRPA
ncbi:helicase [Streptomyces agglomeratus]|uniref:Helicase n=1 Tax=Streptomyces agglomeratus TaxID=285458 RepID=A0A1E5P656_9ACTN|nr:ATP-binding domain-containing protein [Streptomyces agglomeratus]OEJ24947.1 helicase [Streptomyces agglomeratus]OEJ53585.1 helicase [Streptomyces agglomeratus]OEJ60904.1 helicase [Streptomyces agglomeratus]